MSNSSIQFTTYFYGDGSATGNSWTEEVCYLGNDEWLLRLVDDPAFSMSPVSETEPDRYTTANLVAALSDWDHVDMISDDTDCRLRGLLEIAQEIDAANCIALLEKLLADPDPIIEQGHFVEEIAGVTRGNWLNVRTSRGEGTMDFPNESSITTVHLDEEEVRVQLNAEQIKTVDSYKS